MEKIYVRFGRENVAWNYDSDENNDEYNELYLRSAISYMKDLIKAHGTIRFNHCLRLLHVDYIGYDLDPMVQSIRYEKIEGDSEYYYNICFETDFMPGNIDGDDGYVTWNDTDVIRRVILHGVGCKCEPVLNDGILGRVDA